MSPVPEPQLDTEELALFERGVALFNDGFYFECHDVLEDLWSGVRGPSRDFFQGLIQVSVGHYHLGNDNREGARSMFSRALARFAAYPERYFGFDLGAQREGLRGWIGQLDGPIEAAAAAAPPRWHFEAGYSDPRD